LPKEAENITIKTGEEVQNVIQEAENFQQAVNETLRTSLLTGEVISENSKSGILVRFWNWLTKRRITGKVISESELENNIIQTSDSKIIDLSSINETEIAVEYYTQAPIAEETNLSNGKRIVISDPSELNYTDILAYTQIENKVKIENTEKIKLYHYVWKSSQIINQTEEEIVEQPAESNISEINETEKKEITNQTSENITEEEKTPELSENITQKNNSEEVNINNSLGEQNNSEQAEVNITNSVLTGEIILELSDNNSINNTIIEDATEQAKLNNSQGYWSKELVDFSAYDLDNDGMIDYVEWNVPHLSNETYELIIEISKAEHLDENYTFVEDVYEKVKAKDGNYTEIPSGHYLRVTFKQNLTQDRDITIYARGNNSQINVYKENDNKEIARFENVNLERYYKIYLTNLSEGESYSTFDLQSIGNVEYDWVVDPVITAQQAYANSTFNNITAETGFSHLSINNLSTNAPYDSLVGYWNFDGDVNNATGTLTTAYDFSSYNNDGTGFGNANVSTSCGIYGQGGCFNDDGYIRVPDSNSLDIIGDDITVSLWYYPKTLNPSNSVSDYLVVKGSPTGSPQNYQLYQKTNNNGVIEVDYYNLAWNTCTTLSGFLTMNVWQHIVWKKNATGHYIYKNSIMNKSCASTTDFIADTQYLWIGGVNKTYNKVNGSLDNVMIFNTSLTDAQILAIYNNQSARYFSQGTQDILNINLSSAGDENRVNLSLADCQTNFGSSLSGQIGIADGASYIYNGSIVNFTSCAADNLTIAGNPNNVSLRIIFSAGNSTNPFYSPLVIGDITLNSWAEETIPSDTSYPIFSNYWDNNASLIDSGIGLFNVTVTNTNGTVFMQINNTNITATNLTANVYNVSYNFTSSGTYSYYWGAWGNGSNHLYNVSETRNYVVNETVFPGINFTYPTPANNTQTTNTSIEINVSIVESNLANVTFNWNGTNFPIYDNSSLVLMMNFNNFSSLGENDTRVVDVSRYSNNGTVTNAKFNTTNCKYGNCYYFDGNDDYISLSSAPPISSTGNFTYSFWIKVNSYTNGSLTGGNGSYFIDRTTATTPLVSLKAVSGGYGFQVRYDDSSGLGGPSGGLITGNWRHIVMLREYNVNFRLYVDGVNVANSTDTGSKALTVPIAKLGCHASESTRALTGNIDEFQIYNKTLSAAEINQLYMSNLYKYNQTGWNLYVNQSKNSTTGLDYATYTYFASAKDAAGNSNQTETKTITTAVDTTPPSINFTYPTPANNTQTTNTSIEINVSIVESNLNEVNFNWNSTNFTIYNNSLVLMMNFNNFSSLGENSTYVVDVSKYSNNGTAINGAFYNSSGKFGGAYQFDGVDDYINTTISSNANFLNNTFSVSLWFKTTQTGLSVPIGKGADGSTGGWQFGLNFVTVNKIVFRTKNSAGTVALVRETSSTLNDGNWHYIVAVATTNSSGTSGQNIELYLDGALNEGALTNSLASAMTSDTVQIGRRPTGLNFNGSIDEVRIWNRSLSASEINQLYMANLYKYNQTGWNLYINQSKNSTTGLDLGTYTYFASAKDASGNSNSTETRYVTITTPTDTTYPLFSNYYDNNATLVGSGIALFNVTVENTNGTVFLEINNTNYTATNLSSNVYNVSVNLGNGTYSYYWGAWGNGSNHLYNISSIMYYTVNATIDTTAPNINIIFPTNNSNFSYSNVNVNYSVSDANLQACWYSNDTYSGNITLNNCANITTVSWSEGYHNVTIWANDTFGNKNFSQVTFFVDSIAPIVSLISPENNTLNYTSNTIDFKYNVSDAGNIINCSLIINNQINKTVNSPAKDTENNITIYLPDADYLWSINCTDYLNNQGASETKNISINVENAISISLSSKLSQQINWSIESLPIFNQSASENNNSGATNYWINISVTGGTADLYAKASGDLMTQGLDVLGLGNETYSYNLTNSSVPSQNKFLLTTNYSDNKIGDSLNDKSVVYLKFFLSAPASQAAGTYNNSLLFKAVQHGQTP